MFVVQLDAQARFENDENSEVRGAEHERDDAGFQAASMNQNVEEIRERCKTQTDNDARTEVSMRDEDRGRGRC